MPIERNQLRCGNVPVLKIHVALLQASEIQGKADQRCIVSVAASKVQNFDRPAPKSLERCNQLAEDVLCQIRNDVVEPAEHAIVFARIGLGVDAVKTRLSFVRLAGERAVDHGHCKSSPVSR